jgi:predicted DNA-binding protein (MmcQ/YjbR family)
VPHFPGVTKDIKWGEHLCFNIGGKIFLVTAPDNVPVSASFKTSDEDFESLPNRQGLFLRLTWPETNGSL